MTHRSLAALIVLNVVLLAALSVTVLNPTPAEAQFGGRANFTMIAGQATGRDSQSVIYITDLSSGKIAPIFYNASNNKIQIFGGRNISDDLRDPPSTR